MRPTRILHVITGLRQGGAESMLFRLLHALPSKSHHTVVSLSDEGFYGPRIRQLGVEVIALNVSGKAPSPLALFRLYRQIRLACPHVVQTWMYHANLIGGVIARLAGVRAVIWGIRNSFAAPRELSLSSRLAARACAWLSPTVPTAIVCNSTRAAANHKALGYSAKKLLVIPNGYDLSVFSINAELRDRLRREWLVDDDELLAGMVARWDPQKDHATFLQAIAVLAPRLPNLKCLLVGAQMTTDNRTLVSLIDQLGLRRRLILAGPRDDVPAVMNALDLHVLSSAAESFPNTVAEAMACGTPCVVTNVGDAALIVGEADWVVPPRDATALSVAIERCLTTIVREGRTSLSRRCRDRIAEKFSLENTAREFETLWEATAGKLTKVELQ